MIWLVLVLGLLIFGVVYLAAGANDERPMVLKMGLLAVAVAVAFGVGVLMQRY